MGVFVFSEWQLMTILAEAQQSTTKISIPDLHVYVLNMSKIKFETL